MENDAKLQIARLTEEEAKFIEFFRSLAESEKEELVNRINSGVYSYEEE